MNSYPPVNAADIQRVIDLRRAFTTDENVNDYPTASDLRELLDPAAVGTTVHVQLWEDASGKSEAFAIAHIPFCNLYFFIHPEGQEGGIEADIITWAMQHMRESGQTALDAPCRENDVQRMKVLEQHGFQRQTEQTLHMKRSLSEPVTQPRFPDGFVLRPVQGEQDLEAYVQMHREAFGTSPSHMTVEHRLAIMRNPDYRRELDIVAVAPDGRFAAFCICNINREANKRSGQQEGEVGIIGTRPTFRHMGLGQAMLLAGLHSLQACDISVATLGTTSSNLNAIRLYESVGFSIDMRIYWYSKMLPGTHKGVPLQ